MVDKPKDKSTDIASRIRLWSLASEIGFKIAIPLLVFLLAGIALDRWLHTKPLFMFLGIALSLVSSGYLVYQIIRELGEGEL